MTIANVNDDVAGEVNIAFRELEEAEVSYTLGMGAPETGRTTMEPSSFPRMR